MAQNSMAGSSLNTWLGCGDLPIVSIEEVEVICHVSEETVLRSVRSNEIPLIQFGEKRFLPWKALPIIVDACKEHVDNLTNLFVEAAYMRDCVIYTALLYNGKGLPYQAGEIKMLPKVIEIICRNSHAKSSLLLLPFLAVASYPNDSEMPPDYFFDIAKDLGYDCADKHAFVKKQREKIYQSAEYL